MPANQTTTITDVREAHRLAIENCLEKLARIEAQIAEDRRIQDPHWGDVGSLNKIASDLGEVMRFLGLPAE